MDYGNGLVRFGTVSDAVIAWCGMVRCSYGNKSKVMVMLSCVASCLGRVLLCEVSFC